MSEKSNDGGLTSVQRQTLETAAIAFECLAKHVMRRGGGYPSDDDARFAAEDLAARIRRHFLGVRA